MTKFQEEFYNLLIKHNPPIIDIISIICSSKKQLLSSDVKKGVDTKINLSSPKEPVVMFFKMLAEMSDKIDLKNYVDFYYPEQSLFIRFNSLIDQIGKRLYSENSKLWTEKKTIRKQLEYINAFEKSTRHYFNGSQARCLKFNYYIFSEEIKNLLETVIKKTKVNKNEKN